MFLENLSQLIDKKGISRRELARALGISHSTVNSWFNKSTDTVTIKTLADIASYFNVSTDALLWGNQVDEIHISNNDFSKEELELIENFLQFIKKSRK